MVAPLGEKASPLEKDKASGASKDWSLCPLHNAQIEQFGGAVYKIQPYMIPRNILLLRINRVWDSGAYLEPNSMDTEQYL